MSKDVNTLENNNEVSILEIEVELLEDVRGNDYSNGDLFSSQQCTGQPVNSVEPNKTQKKIVRRMDDPVDPNPKLTAEIKKIETIAKAITENAKKLGLSDKKFEEEDLKASSLLFLVVDLENRKDNFYKQEVNKQDPKQLAAKMNQAVRKELIENPQLRSPAQRHWAKKAGLAILNALYLAIGVASIVGIPLIAAKKVTTGTFFFKPDTEAVKVLKAFDAKSALCSGMS